MDERFEDLRGQVEQLTRSVRDLEVRITALEGAAPAEPKMETVSESPAYAAAAPAAAAVGTALATGLAQVGRTFLVLGGAFLLRALTDAGVLPADVGVLSGMGYSLVWVILADRAGATGRAASAGLHGLSCALIAYPLLWEGTTRFEVLSPAATAASLVLSTGLGLFVAWRRRLSSLGWTFGLAAAATLVALLAVTARPLLFTGLLLALGVVSVWLSNSLDWKGLRWLVAVGVNFAFLRLTLAATRTSEATQGSDVSAPAALALTVAFVLAYLGSFVIHSLARRRKVGTFEIIQSAAVLLIGLGGAVRIARDAGAGSVPLGVATLAVGILSYAVSFAHVRSQLGRGVNFYFYTSLALVLVAVGCRLCGETFSTLAWGVLGVAAAILGGRFDRVTLRAHAVIYAAASGWSSGLLSGSAIALAGSVGAVQRPLTPQSLIALALTLASYWTLVATRAFRKIPRLARAPRLLLGLLSLIGSGGIAVMLALSVIMPMAPEQDAGAVAVVRTAVLALAAVALALVGRRARLPELRWLAGAVLAVGGVKLFAEDLRAGRPTTLFLAFALYGLALIVTPRILRPKQREP